MRLSIRTNRLRPVPSVAEAEVDPERAAAEAMPSNAIVGGPATVVAGMRELAAATGADELMLSAITHGVEERIRSLELVAEAWGLPAEGPLRRLTRSREPPSCRRSRARRLRRLQRLR